MNVVVSADLRKRLVAARLAKGLTQEDVAAKLKTTVGTVSRIERGIGEAPRYLQPYLELMFERASPLGVRDETGAEVASTQGEMATLRGPQVPASAIASVEDSIRNEMVNLAIDRGDSVEIIRGLRQAKPPKGATIAWWAGFYADLREQHGEAETPHGGDE